jgi:hypothetical protein
MGKLLTQQDLNAMNCQEPNCNCKGILYLHAQCHPEEPTWCCYHPDGFIIVECSICHKEAVKILVATIPE